MCTCTKQVSTLLSLCILNSRETLRVHVRAPTPLSHAHCNRLRVSTSLWNGHFYLSTLQRSLESACTGFPSAPSRVYPWFPGVCRFHCNQRSRRARRPCSPLPGRIWAGRCSCRSVTVEAAFRRWWELWPERVSTEEGERPEEPLYIGLEMLTPREFHYGSTHVHVPSGAGRGGGVSGARGVQDPQRTGWSTQRGIINALSVATCRG